MKLKNSTVFRKPEKSGDFKNTMSDLHVLKSGHNITFRFTTSHGLGKSTFDVDISEKDMPTVLMKMGMILKEVI